MELVIWMMTVNLMLVMLYFKIVRTEKMFENFIDEMLLAISVESDDSENE